MQFVKVELDPGEAVVGEAGAMMYIEDGIQMQTIFGDGSNQQKGFMGALLGAGKRLLTGESLFMTVFQNQAGRRRPRSPRRTPARSCRCTSPRWAAILAQKDLVPVRGQGRRARHRAFTKRFGAGLFGGEGFHPSSARRATAGVRARRAARFEEKTLAPGEALRRGLGCIVADAADGGL